MTTINQLASAGSLNPSDLIAIFSTANGDARKASITALATAIQSMLSAPGTMETQYFAPNATGFAVLVNPTVDGSNIYLLMTPTAGFAAGTITLPALVECVDGQEVLVSCTQAVTALTVARNGATAVNGAPTALVANGFFRLRFDRISQSWYRIG